MITAETKLSNSIAQYVSNAREAQPSMDAAQTAMTCLDLTSLTGEETSEDIYDLCMKARADNVAAICVYPEHVKQAADLLKGSPVAIATVINFPNGSHRNSGEIASVDTTREDILQAIDSGATEIDIVVDYEKFKSMENGFENEIRDMLNAAKEACKTDAKLKVIVESAAFGQLEELQHITEIALECGADFVKTSTGKHEDGGADLESVAVMAQTVKRYNELSGQTCGLKISGGVNGNNYPQYVALAKNIMGENAMNKDMFRFGASSIHADLKVILDTGGKPTSRRPVSSAHSY